MQNEREAKVIPLRDTSEIRTGIEWNSLTLQFQMLTDLDQWMDAHLPESKEQDYG
jgi:hypothetical protein